MARRVRVSTFYARTLGAHLKHGTPRAESVGRTTRAIAAADQLPGPADYQATGRPFGLAWVRRVGGRNLWLWYRFTDEEVVLVTVTTDPPVPVDDP